ncbi:MAG TPA: molybdenum cofactor carrier protein [Candidatus Binatia bacterium]|nr:molybdenum cofactor carrier protein [Candidatus Binatia bacterium]
MPDVRVRPVVTVIGSGSPLSDAQAAWPFAVGRAIAEAGWHLLTGGGLGVMEATSRGFCSVPHDGLSIGVIPDGRASSAYPNRWIELPIMTHLRGDDPMGPDSRNHITVRSAHALVVFPGSGGTRAELEIALARGAPRTIVACVCDGETVGGLDRSELARRGLVVAETTTAVARIVGGALR